MHDTTTTNPLLGAMQEAIKQYGLPLRDLTVLAAQHDPFRVDTETGRRDGAWLAEQTARLVGDRVIHLRGLHYVLVSASLTKPDGTPYINTEKCWSWLQGQAAKAARWLGYVDWNQIIDQRNDAPTVRRWEPKEPAAVINVALGFDLPAPDELAPRMAVRNFVGHQPYKLVLIGEKSSLREVLAPIAERFQADLYLPAGEASDTMIHEMARVGADDGRPVVVFYFSDCDPAGWHMPISLSRKLQAFQASVFLGLEFQVHRVALSPDQVKAYGLPSSPLKDKELRADAWRSAMGVAQTEIDALAALQPDLLRGIAVDAVSPFFDATLDRRVRAARDAWLREAQAALDDQLGPERLESIRVEGGRRLAEIREQIEALAAQLDIGTEGVDVPGFVIPEAEVDVYGKPLPLIDSEWGFVEGTQRLRAAKAYEEEDV
jgi:hypothetical protein